MQREGVSSMEEESSMAEDIISGIFCQECGQFIGEPIGYPRTCRDCTRMSMPRRRKPKPKEKKGV